MEQKKPWYKSKITLAGILLALAGLSNVTFGFVTGEGVTPEQIAVINATYPKLAEQVAQLAKGGEIFSGITAIAGTLVAVWRVWYTRTIII